MVALPFLYSVRPTFAHGVRLGYVSDLSLFLHKEEFGTRRMLSPPRTMSANAHLRTFRLAVSRQRCLQARGGPFYPPSIQ